MDVISSRLLTTLLLITTVLFTHPLRAAENAAEILKENINYQQLFAFVNKTER